MPNGDDTVQIQMPDGRVLTGPKSNLPMALKMGAKLYDPSKKQPGAEPTGAVAALKELGSGAVSFGKSMLDPRVPVIGKSTIDRSGAKIDPDSMAGSFLSGLPEEGQKARDAWKRGDVLGAAGHGVASVVPGVGPIASRSAEKFEKGDIGGGLVMGGAALLGAKQMRDAVKAPAARPSVVDPVVTGQKATKIGNAAMQTILNLGPSKERMETLQEADALSTKSKLAALDQKVKADAGGLMQKVSQAVDQKMPQGSIEGNVIAKGIRDGLSSYVEAKQLRSSLPSSLQKIIGEAEGSSPSTKTAVRLTNNEQQTLNVLTREGIKGEDLRSALVNMQYAPKQIDAMMQVTEAGSGAAKWTFERAKQLRTELAEELFGGGADNYPGVVRKVMHNAWGSLTKALDTAADSANVGDDWSRAREKYSSYMRDFYGTYERGKYNASPLNQALQGDTAQDIMDPLSGKTAQKARDILRKYAQYMDEKEDVRSDVRRFRMNKEIMKFASPQRFDLIMLATAVYRPEYGIPAMMVRAAIPRIAERMMSGRAKVMESARPAPPVIPENHP